MKNLILLLLFPIMVIGQNNYKQKTEISKSDELRAKQSIRNEKFAPKTPNTVIIQENPRFFDNGFYDFSPYYNPNQITRYIGRDNWRYYQYSPRYTESPYVPLKPFNGTIGLSKSTKLYGLFTTIGKNKFFVWDVMFRPNIDNSEFHSNITLYQAQQEFGDEQLKNIEKGYRVYFGFGQKMGLISPYSSIGIGSRVVNYQFIDEFAVLNGDKSYSFPKFGKNFVGIKFGGMVDFNKFVLKLDIDPINPDISIGAGLRITEQ
jgi:hypothetical protein